MDHLRELSQSYDVQDLSEFESDRLHVLLADWQLLADISCADLVLWLPLRDGRFVAAAQCRPATGQTLHLDDVVGKHAAPKRNQMLHEALTNGVELRPSSPRWAGTYSIWDTYTPVIIMGRAVAVVSREMGSDVAGVTGPAKQWGQKAADLICQMMTRGQYPFEVAPTVGQRGAPRVSDGVMLLDAEGRIVEISPNAISCLRRLGLPKELQGCLLAEKVTKLVCEDHQCVDETLAVVVMGRAAWMTEVETRAGAITLRALPLLNGSERAGAILVCRDVSEMRRREREMMTKDATIREIHHRVKNNLQTVQALLRIQMRRSSSDEVADALCEAERRVGTIAKVHDVLSQTIDETVNFDDLARDVLQKAASMASAQGEASVSLQGSFGQIGADAASALAVVLSELVTNSVEHGFAGGSGRVEVVACRDGDTLTVTVRDFGKGIGAGGDVNGLGTKIVQTLVRGELGGTIDWQNHPEGGTIVTLVANLV
ncbi:MAG: histidine kinase N-terminal domain-containing protein [Actinomycetaceae bacterium]|nr:histidine kinase N-terminal domain-containing protein [Actinomycetaceae bacterium]